MQKREEEDSWPCMHECNKRFCNVNFSEFVFPSRRRSTNWPSWNFVMFFFCCFSQWVGFSFWEGVTSAVEQRLWSKSLPVRVKGGSQVSWAGGEQVHTLKILPNSLLLCSREHLGL
jgi:hypothetical protein